MDIFLDAPARSKAPPAAEHGAENNRRAQTKDEAAPAPSRANAPPWPERWWLAVLAGLCMAGCATAGEGTGQPDPFGPRYCCVAQSAPKITPDPVPSAPAQSAKPGG